MDAATAPGRGAKLARVAGAVLASVALSTALAVWRTWPLAVTLGTGVPTPTYFDWLYTMWTLAWQVHALSAGVSPAAANIYHPAPDALYYGPLCTGLLPFFAPVYLASGSALLAVEVAYVAALALTGVSVHLVVRAWTRSSLAGAVAALTLFGCADVGVLTAPAPHWAVLMLFAPLVWALAHAARWRGAIVVTLLAAGQCVTEPVYVAPTVLAVVGTAGVLRLLAARTRPAGMRLLAAAGGATLLLLPLLMGFVRVRAANPGLSRQTVWQLAGFFASLISIPVARLTLLPQRLPCWFLVPAVMAAALTRGLDRRRSSTAPGTAWLDAGLLAVLPFALTLVVPALARVPGFETLPHLLRVPQRLVLGGFVGVALVGGLAWGELASAARARGGRWAVAALAVAAALPLVRHGVDIAPLRVGMQPEPAVKPIETVLLRMGAGPVLELPARPWDGVENVWAMYRSLGHWRPLLNGYASYWPAGWYERMADAARLPDRAVLARLVHDTGVTTIVVRRSALPPGQRARWTMPLDPPVPGLVPLLQAEDVLIFRVDAAQTFAGGTS